MPIGAVRSSARQAHARGDPGPRRRPDPRVLLAAGVLAALTAGCGSIPGTGAAASGGRNALAFSACMRSHGVPDYPDPRNGGFEAKGTPSTTTVNGVTLTESQAQIGTARQACQQYLGSPGGGGPPSPQQERAALAYATCMRSHGIPNFPDPKVTASSFTIHLPSGVDPKSPQFQAAKRACQSLLPRP